MPRSRGSGGSSRGPSRPSMAPSRPPPPPSSQQQRPSSTMAASPPTQRTPAQQQQAGGGGSGLFGQMASTAAGVAVGSSIGHGITSLFSGGSSAEEQHPVQQQQQQQQAPVAQDSGNNWGARACEGDARNFTRCMDENKGNMQICGWYLDQLKACQQAAGPY